MAWSDYTIINVHHHHLRRDVSSGRKGLASDFPVALDTKHTNLDTLKYRV